MKTILAVINEVLKLQLPRLGNPEAITSVRALVRKNSSDVVFLSETKCYANEMTSAKFKRKMIGCYVVPLQRRSGGLTLIWKEGVDVRNRSFTSHHIDASVCYDAKEIRITGFYRWPDKL